MVDPNGVPTKLGSEVYNASNRTLAVFVGDIYGGETYKVQFAAVIDPSAVGMDIGNIGEAHGGIPSENGKPGHWGSKEEYEAKPGVSGLKSIVEETIKTQSERVYLGATVIALNGDEPNRGAVPTGDTSAYQTAWMMLAAAALGGIFVCRQMKRRYQK